MREKPKDKGRLLHIRQAIDNINQFLFSKSAEDFLIDQMLYFAIVKNLEIIGEAAYMLTEEFRASHTETDWKEIIHMPHILVHGYYQVDSRIVWVTIKNDLPILKCHIDKYLLEMNESQC